MNGQAEWIRFKKIRIIPWKCKLYSWYLGSEQPITKNIHYLTPFTEKEMATHSSILAWRIPWTKEPGGLQSMGSERV